MYYLQYRTVSVCLNLVETQRETKRLFEYNEYGRQVSGTTFEPRNPIIHPRVSEITSAFPAASTPDFKVIRQTYVGIRVNCARQSQRDLLREVLSRLEAATEGALDGIAVGVVE